MNKTVNATLAEPKLATNLAVELRADVVPDSMPNLVLEPREPSLNDARIADYLAAEPEFFARQPSLLGKLRVPHQERGSLSLVEAKLEQQRLRIYELEDERSALLTVASENERIFQVYMELMPRLFDCESVLELELCIRHSLQEQLRIPAVRLIVDGRTFPGAASSGGEQLERLYRERMASQSEYLGRLGKEEKLRLFQDSLVNSFALIRLGTKGELGLLAFGSTDAGHYGSDMDTFLLRQLADVVSRVLPELVTAQAL
ncbi:DUF484 family protein [Oceanisphaera sp. IT1-181]|uniref:DUF484 family protein n=1 Tax=Oceanisphaera sp. IT1-181 TaxID=3081199 RepID=UPI0029CA0157|nr:DUF484 family protein [Oceanisphaera sp. IT1-181]